MMGCQMYAVKPVTAYADDGRQVEINAGQLIGELIGVAWLIQRPQWSSWQKDAVSKGQSAIALLHPKYGRLRVRANTAYNRAGYDVDGTRVGASSVAEIFLRVAGDSAPATLF